MGGGQCGSINEVFWFCVVLTDVDVTTAELSEG